MSTEVKVKLFITQFVSLLNELILLHPMDSSLRLLQTTTNGMIYLDPKNFVDIVIESLAPYKKQILAKDEKFFLKDIVDEFKGNSFVMNEISKIHDIWTDPNTKAETKESIWKYFIFMIKLGNTM
jgi:hypothetical protein